MKSKVAGGVWGGVIGAMVVVLLATAPAVSLADVPETAAGQTPAARLAKAVRHEILMLPYYGVFDTLAFRIDGTDTVVLSGKVTRPTLRSAAERVVGRLEGVAKVVNEIEVLPLSGFDDRLRILTYRSLFSRPGIDRYALPVNAPIRIIVKNGEITLVGVVAREADKNLVGLIARGVPGAFKVTNELVVVKG